jgi:hypothetical protein
MPSTDPREDLAMTALDPRRASSTAPSASGAPWVVVLAWTSAVVAVVDLVFFALIQTVIPPLAIGAVLTAVGLLLLRRARRVGIVVLGLTSAVMLVGNLPFALDHLAHPASAIDFVHAVSGSVGRLLAVLAAVGAWRAASETSARRFAVSAIGLGAATVALAGVAMLATTGDTATSEDVPVVVADNAFPAQIVVGASETLFVDNQDLFRHTFTVEDTDIDVELPAAQGARVGIDLAPGSYDVTCAVPGHEFMAATLEVQ